MLKNYDDPLLSIELKKHSTGNGAGGNLFYYQWVYNGVPFLELYGSGPTTVEYCSKIMESLNAGFRLRRIRDHQEPLSFVMLTSDRLESYAAFIQAATRLSIPVAITRLFCFIRTDGGFNKALGVAVVDNNGKVTHDTHQQPFDDIDEVIVHIWENQAREMFGKQMNVYICKNSCFMGLRFVAAQTPSFVADVKNTTPQMVEYLDAPPLNVGNLVRALSEAITVGGIFPYLLLCEVSQRGYPDYLPELVGLLSSGIPGEMVAQMFQAQTEMKTLTTFREDITIECIKEFCEIMNNEASSVL